LKKLSAIRRRRGAAQKRERQEQAVASVEQDEFVREVIDLFDATLIESSIKPV
jgi:DNA polymerase-3 subunit gamma/tau